MICGDESDTNGCHVAGFSEDVAFDRNFMATHPPQTSHPIGVLLVLMMSVKNYLKQQEIQLDINSCTIVANFVQASVCLPEL